MMEEISEISVKKNKDNSTLRYSAFGCTIFLYLFVYTLQSSTYVLKYTLPISKIELLLIGIITVLGVIYSKWFKPEELFFFVVAYFISSISYCLSHTLTGLLTISIVLFSKEKNIIKMLWIYFYCILFDLIFVITSNVLGIIPTISYSKNLGGAIENRFSLGFMHPNTLSLYILALNIVLYLIISFSKFKLKYILLPVGSIYITYFLARSYTVSLLLLFLLIITLFYKKLSKGSKAIKNYKLAEVIIGIIIILIGILINFIKNNSSNELVSKMGSTVSSRLLMGNIGLTTSGVSLFGNAVTFSNSSYIVLNNMYSAMYFTVDCLYVKMLINEGVLVFCMFFALILKILYSSLNSNLFRASIIISLLIYSIFETGLSSPLMSFIFLCVFYKGETN